MEGLKCPICKTITLAPDVKDGEMFKCTFCQAKYTVTRLRRHRFLSCEGEKIFEKEERALEDFVRGLDGVRLALLLELVSRELIVRLQKKEVAQEG